MRAGAEGARKTASIAVQNQRLEALYAVSALASDAASLTELANAFLRQVEKARADAVAMRWSDEANERYVLLANDGLPRPWRKKSIACNRALPLRPAPGTGAHPRHPHHPTSMVALPTAAKPGLRRW